MGAAIAAMTMALAGLAGGCHAQKSESSDGGAQVSGDAQPAVVDVPGAADVPLAVDLLSTTDGSLGTDGAGDLDVTAPPTDGQPNAQGDMRTDVLARDGGCLPCPSAHQPACAADVASQGTCMDPGSACCDPGDRFWICRCVPHGDGGHTCSWMNSCGN